MSLEKIDLCRIVLDPLTTAPSNGVVADPRTFLPNAFIGLHRDSDHDRHGHNQEQPQPSNQLPLANTPVNKDSTDNDALMCDV